MKVKELAEQLQLAVVSGQQGLNNEVSGGYASDLLSDVMGKADNGQVWVTLQSHKNVVAVASLKDLAAVILVNGQALQPDAIEQSNEEGIPVLISQEAAFEVVGRIYALLHPEG